MKNAVIYVRISQDRKDERLGVERQEESCRKLAKRLKLTVTQVYVDNDVSATSRRRRPAFERLLRDKPPAVIVWANDRLARQPKDMERVLDAGFDVHSVQNGSMDLTSPEGKAVARTLVAWALAQVEHNGRRIAAEQDQRAARGEYTSGTVPFGLERVAQGSNKLKHVTREVAAAREGAKRLIGGASSADVARYLNGKGFTTRAGKPWERQSVRTYYLSETIAGLVRGAPAQWTPIITAKQRVSLIKLFNDPKRRRTSPTSATYLLSGIAICGGCGAPMRSARVKKRDGTKRGIYRCHRVNRTVAVVGQHPYRDADLLDAFISEVVVARLERPDVRKVLRKSEAAGGAKDAEREVRDLRAKLDEAATMFTEDTITAEQLKVMTKRLREALERAEKDLSSSAGVSLPPGILADPRATWGSLTLAQKRAVIRELVTVTVLPAKRGGKGFDPSAVKVEWRTV